MGDNYISRKCPTSPMKSKRTKGAKCKAVPAFAKATASKEKCLPIPTILKTEAILAHKATGPCKCKDKALWGDGRFKMCTGGLSGAGHERDARKWGSTSMLTTGWPHPRTCWSNVENMAIEKYDKPLK